MENILHDILFAVITATIPVLTYYLAKYLSMLFEKIKVGIDSEDTQESLSNIFNLILTVVSSTSQTYVDSLKASGTFDKEAQQEAFMKTKETILSLLSDNYKKIIEDIYGDIDAWLDVQIESAVRNLKNQ